MQLERQASCNLDSPLLPARGTPLGARCRAATLPLAKGGEGGFTDGEMVQVNFICALFGVEFKL